MVSSFNGLVWGLNASEQMLCCICGVSSSKFPVWVEGRLACLGPSYRCTCPAGYTDLGLT